MISYFSTVFFEVPWKYMFLKNDKENYVLQYATCEEIFFDNKQFKKKNNKAKKF